jgi:hypothetical protein
MAKELSEKFYKTHHYNPIQGAYFDPNLEDNYQRQKTESQHMHGMAKYNRMPISVKRGEGMSYDITAPGLVYNQQKVPFTTQPTLCCTAITLLLHCFCTAVILLLHCCYTVTLLLHCWTLLSGVG